MRAFIATWSMAVVVLLGTLGVAQADVPGSSATFGVSDSGIRIKWNATCTGTNYWAVNVVIDHADGGKANGNGYTYDGNKEPTASQDMNWTVAIQPSSARSETFHARVTIECPNGSEDIPIGESNITLERASPKKKKKKPPAKKPKKPKRKKPRAGKHKSASQLTPDKAGIEFIKELSFPGVPAPGRASTH